LQRSEVVALINTLHRFSESLEAVNDFREMWAVAGPDDSAKLIREAEKAAAIRVRDPRLYCISPAKQLTGMHSRGRRHQLVWNSTKAYLGKTRRIWRFGAGRVLAQ